MGYDIIQIARQDVDWRSFDVFQSVDISCSLVFFSLVKAALNNCFNINLISKCLVQEIVYGPIGGTLHHASTLEGVRHDDMQLVRH